jgi:hypothetical protein
MGKTKTTGAFAPLSTKTKQKGSGGVSKKPKVAERSGRESPGATDPVFEENFEEDGSEHESQLMKKKKKKKKSVAPATKTSKGGKKAGKKAAKEASAHLAEVDDDDDASDYEEEEDEDDNASEGDVDVGGGDDDLEEQAEEMDVVAGDADEDEEGSPGEGEGDAESKLAQIEVAIKQLRKGGNIKLGVKPSAEKVASLLEWDLEETEGLMKRRDSLRKKAANAKRRSTVKAYKACAKVCGYDASAKTVVAANAFDAHMPCLSDNDIARLGTTKVRTPEQTSYSQNEFEARDKIASVNPTQAEVREIGSHIDPIFKAVVTAAIKNMMAQKNRTVKPHHVFKAVEKMLSGMRFGSPRAPPGLIAHAKATKDAKNLTLLPLVKPDKLRKKHWAENTKKNAVFRQALVAKIESDKAERKARIEANATPADVE